MRILLIIVVSLLIPILQPVSDYGASKMRETFNNTPPQQQQAQWPQDQPRIVYHNGEWWKYENNQWYVWRQNNNALASGPTSIRR